MKRTPISAEELRQLLNAELAALAPCAGVTVTFIEVRPAPDAHGCNWRVGGLSPGPLAEPCASLEAITEWAFQSRYQVSDDPASSQRSEVIAPDTGERNTPPWCANRTTLEPVRKLFNERAARWSRKYRPYGKLPWRLDEFCSPLRGLVPAPAKVLDLGCGTGQLAAHLQKHGYVVTGCDIAETMLAMAQRRFGSTGVRWMQLACGWRELPFPNGTFDAVVASSVFEYVDDLELVLGEIARVLRADGVLLCNVPNPEHARRQREQRLTQRAEAWWVRAIRYAVPRVGRYFHYLSLSKNRFALAAWAERALRKGFCRVDINGARATKGALFLFGFRKGSNPAGPVTL